MELQHFNRQIIRDSEAHILCSYSVMLEAWRRGLKVRFYKEQNIIKYNIESKERSHTFHKSRGDKVTREAAAICVNKEQTREYLIKAGVPCPKGKRFIRADRSIEEMLKYADEISYPVVVKPTSGSQGNGVFANIQDKKNLEDIIKHLVADLNYKDLVLESHIAGEDFRVYVIEDQIIGAIKRVPPSVTGDGKRTIEQLINDKNQERRKNPFFRTGLIKFDKEVLGKIEALGYQLDTVLETEETIFLRNIANASAGGETFDVTNQLSDKVKECLGQAIQSVPGLFHAGVDILIDNMNMEDESFAIIEINSRAELGIHLFPSGGKARDIPSALVDYYFPETADMERQDSLFFNYKEVFHAIRKRSIQELLLPLFTEKFAKAKRIHIPKLTLTPRTKSIILNRARLFNVHGQLSTTEQGTFIDYIGVTTNMDKFEKYLTTTYSKEESIISSYSKPLMTGFQISN